MRLNLNARVLQTRQEDVELQNKRLITSLMIASLVNVHKVTFNMKDRELRDLLRCLTIYVDPESSAWRGFEALLRHFPTEENLR